MKKANPCLSFLLALAGILIVPHTAAAVETVHTFGNGDLIQGILQSVANMRTSGDYRTFLSMMVMFGAFGALIRAAFAHARGVSGWRISFIWLLAAVAVYNLVFRTPLSVNVHDEILNTDSGVISGVPAGLAKLASITTTAEEGIAKAADTFFSVPTLSYTNAGYGFGLLSLANVSHVATYSPRTAANWHFYIVDCVIPAILHGDISEFELEKDDNIIGHDTLQNTSGALYTIYIDPSGRRTHVACSSDYNTIKADLQNDMNTIRNQYALRVMGDAGFATAGGVPAWTINDVMDRFQTAAQRYLNASGTSLDLLRQAVMINVLNNASQDVLAEYSDNPDAYILAKTAAQLQAKNTLAVSASLAKTFVPAIRQVVEALIYGIFPIIVGLLFVPGTGRRIFQAYLTLFLWLIWWSPIYSILNYIVDIRARNVFTTVYSSTAGHFSLNAWPQIMSGSYDVIGSAANLLWFVPILSYALASGSTHAFVSLASGLGSQIKALGSSAAAGTAATPGGIGSTASTGRTLEQADWAQKKYGMSWVEMQNQLAALEGIPAKAEAALKAGGPEGVLNSILNKSLFDLNKSMQVPGELGTVAGNQLAGELMGVNKAYQNAQKHGFKGSMADYFTLMSQMATEGKYTDANAVKKAAQKFYGGDTQALLQDVADWNRTTLGSMMARIRKEGLTPEALAIIRGDFKGLDEKEAYTLKQMLGEDTERAKIRQFVANEASKAVIRRAEEEIGSTGHMSERTQEDLAALMSTKDGRAALMHQGLDRFAINDAKQAQNWARWLKAHGKNVDWHDLVGAELAWSAGVNKDGSLTPGFTVAKQGQQIASLHEESKTGEVSTNLWGQKFSGEGEQDKLGSGKDAYIKTTFTASPEQLHQMAELLKNHKYSYAANGAEGLARNKKSAKVTMITTGDGKLVGLKIGNEVQVGNMDVNNIDHATHGQLGTYIKGWSGHTPDGRYVTSADLERRPDGTMVLHNARYSDGSYGEGVYDPSGNLVYWKDQQGAATPNNAARVVEDSVLNPSALKPYLHNPSSMMAFARKFTEELNASQTAKIKESEGKQINRELQTRLGAGANLGLISGRADIIARDQFKKGLENLNQRDYVYALTTSILADDKLSTSQKAVALNYFKQRFGLKQEPLPKVQKEINDMKESFKKGRVPTVNVNKINDMTAGTTSPGGSVNINSTLSPALKTKPNPGETIRVSLKNVNNVHIPQKKIGISPQIELSPSAYNAPEGRSPVRDYQSYPTGSFFKIDPSSKLETFNSNVAVPLPSGSKPKVKR